MFRAPNSLIVLDLYTEMSEFLYDLEPFIKGPRTEEKISEMFQTITGLTKDVLDDIITENLYWTEATTVATAERYMDKFVVKEGLDYEVMDHLDSYIVTLEDVLFSKNILPSWSYFTVEIKQSIIIVHSSGDFRIDDWMKRHGRKIKKTRFSTDRGRR